MKPVQTAAVLLGVVATLLLPYLGSLLHFHFGPIPGFLAFPPERVVYPPPFCLPYFLVACAAGLVIVAFLLFPAWFGFKPMLQRAPATAGRFPAWFWVGLLVCGISWYVMWFSGLGIVKYFFTPLWWGFISALDGWVYQRTGGASIYSKLPKQMFWLAITSVIAWFAFEWLNYFVLENWAYPNSPKIFSLGQALFWFSLTYTCVFPAIFEFYTLLRTFRALEARWARGPIVAPKPWLVWLILVGGAFGALCVGIFPYALFFVVWIASLLILPEAMGLAGLPMPFDQLKKGNWSPLVLCALGSPCTGFFWELWNHGSNVWHRGLNPNFWVYDVPYVNVRFGFTEMPFLGYLGYLPFGVQCWVWWLVLANLLGLPIDFDPEHQGLPGAGLEAAAARR